MRDKIMRFLRDEEGSVSAEYTVLTMVMGAGSIGAVASLRDGQIEQFTIAEERLSIESDSSGANTGGGG
jgi:Flp pilus assembly pilin Flp